MTPIEEIEKYGFTKLRGVYSQPEVDKMLSLVKEWSDKAPQLPDESIPRLNKNSPNLYNLQNKDKFFIDMLFKSEEVEKILIELLNDKYYKAIPADKPNYILRHAGCRSSKEALPLHIDSFIPYKEGPVIAMQMAILLEDSDIRNGCTVVVPESHKSGEYADPDYDEVLPIEGNSGDVLLWDSRLWHGTTANITKGTRWAIVSTFTRYWIKQMFNIPESLPNKVFDQLTSKQKSILGFSSIPFNNESEGIDLKRGYKN